MKTTTYHWLTAGFSLEEGEQQRATPEGLPLFAPNGDPVMEKVTTLVLIRQTQDEQEILKIPFNEEGKAKLVTALSGGVKIVNPADLRGFKL